ncbi:putative ERAD-associated E3 ubiquitin-protein ligase component [Schizosaccharomyces pombe]
MQLLNFLICLFFIFKRCVFTVIGGEFSYDNIDKKPILVASYPEGSRFNVSASIKTLPDLVTLTFPKLVKDPGYVYEEAEKGDPESQFLIAMLYAMGPDERLGLSFPRNEPLSRIFLELSATQNYTYALLALAYKHLNGLSTPMSVDKGVELYKQVAHQISCLVQPLSHFAPDIAAEYPVDLYDLSRTSSYSVQKKDDIVEYLKDYALRGNNISAHISLATIYQYGTPGKLKDIKLAVKHYLAAIRLVNSGIPDSPSEAIKSIHNNPRHAPTTKETANSLSIAAFRLGCMALHGELGKPDPSLAYAWFEYGVSLNHSSSKAAIAYMYFMGYPVAENTESITKLLENALASNDPLAFAVAGKVSLANGQIDEATVHLIRAVSNGHLESALHIADIYYGSNNQLSIAYYENFISRVLELFDVKTISFDPLTRHFAHRLSAELGNLMSQILAAKDRDPSTSYLKTVIFPTNEQTHRNARIAMNYYSRAAARNHIHSLIKIGDFYRMGLGTSAKPELAFSYYSQAAAIHPSALAYWRLGWMHEYGVGVPVDFEMAKKNYDNALMHDTRAFLAVTLARLRMRLSSPDSWFSNIYRILGKVTYKFLKLVQYFIINIFDILSPAGPDSQLPPEPPTLQVDRTPQQPDPQETSESLPSPNTEEMGESYNDIRFTYDYIDGRFLETACVTLIVVVVGLVLMRRHQQHRLQERRERIIRRQNRA